jgi:hypothetical protein
MEWLSRVRRDTGGPGEDQVAGYVAQQLDKNGVRCEVHEFNAFLSYPVRATLEVIEPEQCSFRAITHSFGRSTGPGGVIAQLKHVPDGVVSHGAGCAVLVDGLLSPIKVLEASRCGVSALIYANTEWFIHNMVSTTIWGTPGLFQVDRIPNVPVISVNDKTGARLKELLARGPLKVRVVTEVKTGWFRSRLPEAIIPGAVEPEQFVLVGGHSCSWELGVTDNSTGIAALLEIARLLNQRRLQRSVRIGWWPGHSHGRYAGSTWYADRFWENLDRNCLAYHNIDSPGVRGATYYIARHTSAEVERFIVEIVSRLTGQAEVPVHRPSKSADQSFLNIGVPSFSCYPFLPEGHPDRRPWTGGSGGAWWWHTEHDTPEKYDANVLANDVRLSATAVLELCQARVLPIDFMLVASELTELLRHVAVAAGGYLDMSTLRAKAEAFQSAARMVSDVKSRLSRCEVEKTGGAGADAKVQRLNRLLMQISRILMPVTYTSSSRFTHDSADLVPVMRAEAATLFPELSKAELLAGLSGRHEFGFLVADLTREMNRVGDALDRATELVRDTIVSLI